MNKVNKQSTMEFIQKLQVQLHKTYSLNARKFKCSNVICEAGKGKKGKVVPVLN
jgi:hypothetical protein